MKNKIIEIIQEYSTGKVPSDPSVDLLESGLLDSFAIMSILPELEDEFDIEIEEKDISKENFTSVDSLEKMIIKCMR